jgi:hypothetical protein
VRRALGPVLCSGLQCALWLAFCMCLYVGSVGILTLTWVPIPTLLGQHWHMLLKHRMGLGHAQLMVPPTVGYFSPIAAAFLLVVIQRHIVSRKCVHTYTMHCCMVKPNSLNHHNSVGVPQRRVSWLVDNSALTQPIANSQLHYSHSATNTLASVQGTANSRSAVACHS